MKNRDIYEKKLKELSEINKKKMEKDLENKKKIVIDENQTLLVRRDSSLKQPELDLNILVLESKTSKIVTDSITKKVIILIISILILLPILEEDFYAADDNKIYLILANLISNYLKLFNHNNQINNNFFIYNDNRNNSNNFINGNFLPSNLNSTIFNLILIEHDFFFPIVNITNNNNIYYSNNTFENLEMRKSDLDTAISHDNAIVIIFSLSNQSNLLALLNIIKTLCLCFLVTIATIYFERDVKNLVLDPLESMIEIVDKVAKDPIKARNLDNLETGMKSLMTKMNSNTLVNNKKKLKNEYEVNLIKSAIMKISALLAIGIGEAGKEIIKENLTSISDLNPMVDGRKKNAIFGFCCIRDFRIVNEVLQEDTVLFLNQIADIVHSCVDFFGGSTNKNIGEAFLMVWRLPDKLRYDKDSDNDNENHNLYSNKYTESPNDKKDYMIDIEKFNNNNNKYIEIDKDKEKDLDMDKDKDNDKHEKRKRFSNLNLLKKAPTMKSRQLLALGDNFPNDNNDNENNNLKNNNININEKDNNNNKNNNHENNSNNAQEKITKFPEIDPYTIIRSKNHRKTMKLLEENHINYSKDTNKIADSAVFSYLKVITKINKDLRIYSYEKNKEISEKIEDFRVKLGFGLHFGWAIEGAIGSTYKIDASYLSPNVNMASRLENLTKQYKVNFLISGPFYNLLSNEVKNYCRLIDIITVKGSILPIKIYTIDMKESSKISKKLKKDFSHKEVMDKQIEKKKLMKTIVETFGINEWVMRKKSFRKLLKNARPKIFNIIFKEGFNNYIIGDWEEAKIKFLDCLKIYENDGPSSTILDYMKEFEFKAPNDWAGYRKFSSK